jgi:beta-1,4-mannosyltransferase
MIVPWRRGISAPHLLDDALSAVTAADWATDEPPVAWIHWPVDLSNPYQKLIYSRFPRHNLIPIRLHEFDQLDALLGTLPTEMGRVLHVHWLYEVTVGSASEAQAMERVKRFEARIGELRDRGVRLVWTVHNVLPHEMVHPDAEVRLRRFMFANVDVVHVMHDSHIELLRSAFEVEPATVVVAPHPSFAGAYPDWVDRAGSRAHLGIPRGARVLVTFGQIRPYKGHSAFLDAFSLAAERDPQLRWLVAGKIRDEAGAAEFGRRAADHPAVLLHPGFVPDNDVQFYLRAADAAVYPYLSSLNSGAIALTASFDLPAYASSGTSLGGLMPDEAVTRFDLDDREATAAVLTRRQPAVSPAVRDAVRARIAEFAPAQVSERMATELWGRLAGQVPAGSMS